MYSKNHSKKRNETNKINMYKYLTRLCMNVFDIYDLITNHANQVTPLEYYLNGINFCEKKF